MTGHALLLETFADARRTWDDLVGLQLDVRAGNDTSKMLISSSYNDGWRLTEWQIDMLAEGLDTERQTRRSRELQDNGQVSASGNARVMKHRSVSNILHSTRDPQRAASRRGEPPLDDIRDRHTSHKAGSRSIAQKESESRYPDRSMPTPEEGRREVWKRAEGLKTSLSETAQEPR